MNIIARTRVEPGSLATVFLREIQLIDPDLRFGTDPSSLDERLEREFSYRANRAMGILFLIFAAIALLLASIGLYAVIAHSVSRHTQEIGIRIAIGAKPRDIRNLVFKEGMLPSGIGLTIGLAASFAVTRVLKSVLVEVSPADPISYMVASTVLIVAAVLGCWIPARRAMRVDPMVALRHE